MNRSQALMLLAECTGDDIWSIAHCKQRKVPQAWIDELCDAYESGFRNDCETIYYQHQPVSQFEGIRDVDLACRLGALLGVDIPAILAMHRSRASVVRAIRETLEE